MTHDQATSGHQEQDNALLASIQKAGTKLLDGSIDDLLNIATAIARVANTLAEDINRAERDFPSESVRSLCASIRPALTVLCQTGIDFQQRKDRFSGDSTERMKSNREGLERPDSKQRMETASNIKEARVFTGFKAALEQESKDFKETFTTFTKVTGGNPNNMHRLGSPALDLVLFYFELSVHKHLGPFGTLYHLWKLRKETMERLAHPLMPTFGLFFALDSLIEAMTQVSISLRRLPEGSPQGVAIAVSKEVATASFDAAVEAAKADVVPR